jgi:hypothetical protein
MSRDERHRSITGGDQASAWKLGSRRLAMMMKVDASFWLGLLAAVPLSVLANIVTPPIARKLEKRSRPVKRRFEKRARQEAAFADWLIANPTVFLIHFTASRIRVVTDLCLALVLLFLYLYLGLYPLPSNGFSVGLNIAILAYLLYLVSRLYFRDRRNSRIVGAVFKRSGWVEWDITTWSNGDQKWQKALDSDTNQ